MDGDHAITARQTEPGQTESLDSPALTITIDTVAPVVSVDTLTTEDTTPPLTGTIDDPNAAISITLDGNTYDAVNNGDGTWSLPDNVIAPPLPPGTYDVQALATDLAGNVGQDATADELTVDFADCNENSIPDAEDIDAGTSADCNANGVPDECDTADGTSEDANGNGIPDECEVWGIWYVDDDALNDPGPGDPALSDPQENGSAARPFDAIQEALDAASWSGETVLVADGTYTGNGNHNLEFFGRPTILRSDHGPHRTIIDCQSSGRGIWFGWDGDSDVVVSGFTITNGSTSDGGAIYIGYNSPTLINCVLRENSAGTGGAVYCGMNSAPRFVNCVVSDNSAGYAGSAVYNSDSGPEFVNCTIANNGYWAISNDEGSHSTFANCIIWNGWGSEIENLNGSTVTISYSDIWGGWSGTGNIDDDPEFVDYYGGNLRLSPGSPCIDAADNTAVPSDVADLDGDGDTAEPTPRDLYGVPRFIDDPQTVDTGNGTAPIVDIGAYEYIEYADCNGNGVSDDVDIGEGTSEDCNGNAVPDECDFAGGTSADCNENGIPDECDIADATSDDCNKNGIPDACDIADGTSADVNGDGIPDDCGLVENLLQGTYYATLGAAIADAVDGDELIAGPAIYREVIDFDGKAITLRSSGGAAVTSIDAEGLDHSVVMINSSEGADTVLDGFTITNGAASWATAHVGGGIFCVRTSPTISNCIIVGNTAFAYGPFDGQGGGMFCSVGAPTLVNCIISGNEADVCAGVYAYSGNLTMINCTVSGNHTGGGFSQTYGNPTLVGCIVWGNEPYDIDGSPTLNYSAAPGQWPGEGNIEADPQFVRDPDPGDDGEWGTSDDDYGDLRLSPGSPCVDGGDTAALPADVDDLDGDGDTSEPIPFDVDGDARIVYCRVDMGAYESEYFFDCDDNGLADACEIQDGTAEDCNGNGVIDECDLDQFRVTRVWTTFDAGRHGVGNDPVAYHGAVFDGRYVYYAPYMKTGPQLHGEVLRYDTTGTFAAASSWATFDVVAEGVATDPGGYRGALFDGRYVYLVPMSGEVVRYDTTTDFSNPSSWAAYAPGEHGVGENLGGYDGGAFDGRFIYFAPDHGEVLRFDTTLDFEVPSSWAAFNPGDNGVELNASGYRGATFVEPYVYFVPFGSVYDTHGEVLRYDTLQSFTATSSWTAFDPGENGVGEDPDGYDGAVFDGQYIYFSPHLAEPLWGLHGEVLRYNTAAGFNDASSWDTFDPGDHGVGDNPDGYVGAVFDGRYIYFAPEQDWMWFHGEVLRYDTNGGFGVTSSWSTFDPGSRGVGDHTAGYGGLVMDDRYIYFVPWLDGVSHGEVLRHDPTGVSLDCNLNGIPDECDIANGTSEDTNENGIPDECEPPEWITVAGQVSTVGESALSNVTISATNDGSSVVTGPTGGYELTLPYDQPETITPCKDGWRFEPPSRSYDPLMHDLTGEDYVGTLIYDIDPPEAGDDQIGVGDLSQLATSWLQATPPGNEWHDFDCDDFVGVGDLSYFATAWQRPAVDPDILFPPCQLCEGRHRPPGSVARIKLEVIGVSKLSAELEVAELPASLERVRVGEEYWLEVWVRDDADESLGVTSAYCDLRFPAAVTAVRGVEHDQPFALFESGSVRNALIDELGGSNLNSGSAVGVWTRVAHVRVLATAAGVARYGIRAGETGLATYGRGLVPPEQVATHGTAVIHARPGVSPTERRRGRPRP